MNFFGHAVVASWHSSEPPFVLGAMLPDLAEMLRARLARAQHPLIAQGVRWHLATDRCFHLSEVFRALEARALVELCSGGVAKGPRRGVAHVGVELLIDDALSLDLHARSVFRAALHWGAEGRAETCMESSSSEPAASLGRLCERLLDAGRQHTRVTPERLAAQLMRILGQRPRLALEARDAGAIVAWARAAQPEVERRLPELLAELRTALARQPELDATAPHLDAAAPAPSARAGSRSPAQ
jgi:hypothetical protein